jgi:hypothetical protein
MFTLAELGPQSVRGVNTPIPVFRVLREAPTGSRFEALRRAALAPLIGREHELALLVNRWETAKAGEGQLILLSGEAGIGKSRLVLCCASDCEANPASRSPIPAPRITATARFGR